MAALAGCLNVVGHLVAKEMGFQIDKLEIEVYGPLNPARLFGKSYEDRAGYKEITAEMKVDADVDEETLKKWVEAVEDRCPVSDNLGNSTPVRVLAKELKKA